MAEGKPVRVRRGAFGTWFATRGEKTAANGLTTAATKFHVENGRELEELWDAHSWLNALLQATGKTREQLADDYDLVIGPDTGNAGPASADCEGATS